MAKLQVNGVGNYTYSKRAALRLRNDAAIFSCCLNPELNGFLRVPQRFRMGLIMSHTARKLWHISDERLIFVAPEDDDFVPALPDQISDKRYFK